VAAALAGAYRLSGDTSKGVDESLTAGELLVGAGHFSHAREVLAQVTPAELTKPADRERFNALVDQTVSLGSSTDLPPQKNAQVKQCILLLAQPDISRSNRATVEQQLRALGVERVDLAAKSIALRTSAGVVVAMPFALPAGPANP